ncbi:MAG: TatD family hydrolase [Planctomycetota bacterium]
MIDSHAHCDSGKFSDDRHAMVERAWEAGLSHVVQIAMVPDHARALRLAEQWRGRIRVAAGVHPHDSAQWSDDTEVALRDALSHDMVTALGEIGLDWFRNYAPKEVQETCFRRQLEIAQEFNLPFVLHCRDAYDDCVRIIREVLGDRAAPVAADARPTGVAHCFSGDTQQGRDFIDCGMLLSFAGQLTYDKSTALRDAAAATDTVHCMVETDCPYLTPVPHRGKRNEPAFVVHTAQCLADLQGKPVAEVDRITSANAVRMFRLPV